jgi:hypothetical protein
LNPAAPSDPDFVVYCFSNLVLLLAIFLKPPFGGIIARSGFFSAFFPFIDEFRQTEAASADGAIPPYVLTVRTFQFLQVRK